MPKKKKAKAKIAIACTGCDCMFLFVDDTENKKKVCPNCLTNNK